MGVMKRLFVEKGGKIECALILTEPPEDKAKKKCYFTSG